jgi:outer membrane protein TolC
MHTRWLLLLFAAVAPLGTAAPLTFQAALDLAERQGPTLAARTARTESARSAAVSADSLPDPKLIAGLENVPVQGPERWTLNSDPMTMGKVGLMQEVPNSAKREARRETAQAAIDRAETEEKAEALKLKREAAAAWIGRYYAEQRVGLFDKLEQENRVLAEAVRAQIAGGRGQPSDTVMPRQEEALLADRRDELARDVVKSVAELRRLIGPAADEPLAGTPPAFDFAPEATRQHLLRHPELAAFAPMLREAQAQVREAEAIKKPDWGVQVAYQRRWNNFGDMVSVEFTMDLPLFSATRQDPQIAARQREVVRIEAEREAMERDHLAELESDLGDYSALARQIDRAEHVSLPLAQEKAELQLASYRAGKSDVAALIAARKEWIEQRLRLLDLNSRRDTLAARLTYLYGEKP